MFQVHSRYDLADARLAAISRTMAVAEYSPEGLILDVNELFCTVLGWSAEDLRGRYQRQLLPGGTFGGQRDTGWWADMLASQGMLGTFEHLDAHDRPLWLESRYLPVLDEFGEVSRVLHVAADVTDRVLAERRHHIARARAAYVIDGLFDELTHAVDSIDAVHQQHTSINRLIQTIRGITDQTQMLALTATLEVARAGERHEGLALVAGEVSQLAERTRQVSLEFAEVMKQNRDLSLDAIARLQARLERGESPQAV